MQATVLTEGEILMHYIDPVLRLHHLWWLLFWHGRHAAHVRGLLWF
jgi:hypothetical protein